MTWPNPGDSTPETNRPSETPPGPQPPGPQPPSPQPGPQPPASPEPGPPPPAGAYAYPGVPVAQNRTNSMAIVALVCALGGFFTIISAPVGAILGHVARRQIRQSGEEGDGLALAAIIVGWGLTGLFVLGCCAGAIVFFVAAGTTTIAT